MKDRAKHSTVAASRISRPFGTRFPWLAALLAATLLASFSAAATEPATNVKPGENPPDCGSRVCDYPHYTDAGKALGIFSGKNNHVGVYHSDAAEL